LHELVPEPEVAGLLALMLLTDARRAARTGPAGELIPLDEQDRTLWDRSLIQEGVHLVATAIQKGQVGCYQLQAIIAALHDEAESTDKTEHYRKAAQGTSSLHEGNYLLGKAARVNAARIA
jgi:predicted RNA polymerase sigma factor